MSKWSLPSCQKIYLMPRVSEVECFQIFDHWTDEPMDTWAVEDIARLAQILQAEAKEYNVHLDEVGLEIDSLCSTSFAQGQQIVQEEIKKPRQFNVGDKLRINLALERLKKFWPLPRHCPVCTSNEDWAMSPDLHELRQFKDGRMCPETPLIPLVVLNCETCGYHLFFNAKKLGAMS